MCEMGNNGELEANSETHWLIYHEPVHDDNGEKGGQWSFVALAGRRSLLLLLTSYPGG